MTDDGSDDAIYSPLGALGGRVPSAPAWFEQAIALAPERRMLPIRGGEIEVLGWGDRGRPATILMHGSAAHADIWRPFAPFFAETFRVIAFSWPGMGRSTWRDRYELDEFADDIVDIAETDGLFDAPRRPIMIAHSMGGVPTAIAAHRHGLRFGGAIIADTPLSPEPRPELAPSSRPEHPHRLYPSLGEALARFRFAPVQPSPNLFLTDMIARDSLEETAGGWRWRFDPGVRKRMTRGGSWAALAAPACPLAFVTGGESALIDGLMPQVMARVPPGTPHIVIPDAHHHLMMDQPIAFISVLRSILALWASDPDGTPSA